MDIHTDYNSLTNQLKISSGTASDASGASAASTTTTANSSAGNTDTASWSAVAKALSRSDSEYLSPILKYKSQNQALQQQLTKTLAAKFGELGVDTSQTITLGRGADGSVVVEGDHPDKAKIENLFKETPVLAQAFNTLADNSATLKSMTRGQATAMVRSNGYAAYLNQLTGGGASAGDFYMSLARNTSMVYFR